jgi:integrase
MASIFKKYRKRPLPSNAEILSRKREGLAIKVARWVDGRGTKRTADLHDDGQHILVESNDYYARYVDSNGIKRRPSTGCSDKQAAEQVLRDLIAQTNAISSGLTSQEVVDAKEHAKRPVTVHVEEYIEHLRYKTTRGRRTSPVHLANVERQLKRLMKDCELARLSHITKSKVAHWMNERENKNDMAGRTINTFRSAAMAFCRWCVSDGRLISNPLDGLYTADETKKERQRRALTEKEIGKLLRTAQDRPMKEAMTIRSGPRQGQLGAKVRPEVRQKQILAGKERSLIYETMITTGLRKGELTALKVSDLHLDAKSPYVEVRAEDTKDARADHLPLRVELAAKLKAWTQNKLPGASIFQVPKDLRKILYRDLASARIQSLDEHGRPIPDDQGRKVDVHALRHTAGTQLAKAGVLPQVASRIMRHSTIDMTMKHYTHLALEDKSKAVERLPIYEGGFGVEEARKTGTDCLDGGGDHCGAHCVVKGGDQGGDRLQAHHDRNCHNGVTGKISISGKQPLEGFEMGSFGMACHQKGECPGEDLNLHVPKDTSPSS